MTQLTVYDSFDDLSLSCNKIYDHGKNILPVKTVNPITVFNHIY